MSDKADDVDGNTSGQGIKEISTISDDIDLSAVEHKAVNPNDVESKINMSDTNTTNIKCTQEQKDDEDYMEILTLSPDVIPSSDNEIKETLSQEVTPEESDDHMQLKYEEDLDGELENTIDDIATGLKKSNCTSDKQNVPKDKISLISGENVTEIPLLKEGVDLVKNCEKPSVSKVFQEKYIDDTVQNTSRTAVDVDSKEVLDHKIEKDNKNISQKCDVVKSSQLFVEKSYEEKEENSICDRPLNTENDNVKSEKEEVGKALVKTGQQEIIVRESIDYNFPKAGICKEVEIVKPFLQECYKENEKLSACTHNLNVKDDIKGDVKETSETTAETLQQIAMFEENDEDMHLTYEEDFEGALEDKSEHIATRSEKEHCTGDKQEIHKEKLKLSEKLEFSSTENVIEVSLKKEVTGITKKSEKLNNSKNVIDETQMETNCIIGDQKHNRIAVDVDARDELDQKIEYEDVVMESKEAATAKAIDETGQQEIIDMKNMPNTVPQAVIPKELKIGFEQNLNTEEDVIKSKKPNTEETAKTINETEQQEIMASKNIEHDDMETIEEEAAKTIKETGQEEIMASKNIEHDDMETIEEEAAKTIKETGQEEIMASKNREVDVTETKAEAAKTVNEIGQQEMIPQEIKTQVIEEIEVKPFVQENGKPSVCEDDITESEINKTKTSVETDDQEAKVEENVASEFPQVPKVLPSSSYEVADASDEIPEVTDSLGLLAESSRTLNYEDQDDEDDGDDEEFDDQDDESNQMTTEYSEDSSAQQSEVEVREAPAGGKDEAMDGSTDNAMDSFASPADASTFQFQIQSVVGHAETGSNDTQTQVENQEDLSVTRDAGQSTSSDAQNVDITTTGKNEVTNQQTVSNQKLETSSVASTTNVELSRPDDEQNGAVGKAKRLQISTLNHVLNIVELEESSSEDDVQHCKTTQAEDVSPKTAEKQPEAVDSSSSKADHTHEGPAKAKTEDTENEAVKKFGLQVFNLDSDDEGDNSVGKPAETPAPELLKCVNHACAVVGAGAGAAAYVPAPSFVLSYLEVRARRGGGHLVCRPCLEQMSRRMQGLINGVKDMRPLLELDMEKKCQELVEISDSDSESDNENAVVDPSHRVTDDDLKCLEGMDLGELINSAWSKYGLDNRLKTAEGELAKQLGQIEKESAEVDAMLDECQAATDRLRSDLYAAFAEETRQLEPVEIVDVGDGPALVRPCAVTLSDSESSDFEARRSKRQRRTPPEESNVSKSVIPLGFTTTDKGLNQTKVTAPLAERNDDDGAEVSVVRLSAEAAPAGLPAPGELQRTPPRAGDDVYAMRTAFGTWVKAAVIDVWHKPGTQFSVYKVLIKGAKSNKVKLLNGRHIAYSQPANVRLTIGTRVIALFKDTQKADKRESFYPGIVAEIPNPVNNYRYLVFFDDGYAQYVEHARARAVAECSPRVWDDVQPDSREFVRGYLLAYPERPMVRLHAGQSLKTEWNGKWWSSVVVAVDASLVQVYFEADRRTEWVYRGSTRLFPLFLELQAAARQRARGVTRANKTQSQGQNLPYVEYTRSSEAAAAGPGAGPEAGPGAGPGAGPAAEGRRQRAVAKKSTTAAPPAPAPAPPSDTVTSRVVYYTPKAAVRPHKMAAHACSARCRRGDVLPLRELRTYNPLARPLLSGWERQILRFKGRKLVMYRAPCGRRLRSMPELHRYLRLTHSDMAVDLFDFDAGTHCLAEFVLNRCNVSKKDLSHGKENVPVPCVNYYDSSLPEFCSYNTERTPTAGVPLNLDPEFLCGCDCLDDCQDKSKCACWRMTLEGARTIGMEGPDLGYAYKRLPDPLPTGIFECNSRCKCKHTCLNRVAQHPLQLKLQVFKTMNRGWGIRALNDVPKGAFVCVYAGNLLTDATANLDGLNEGDEYLAELDYIEVVEQMKEGYESDVPEKDKQLAEDTDSKADEDGDDDDDEETSSDDEATSKDEDDDFKPAYDVPQTNVKFSKHLRKREKKENRENEKKKEETPPAEKEGAADGDCITISDDEEVREPSRFTVKAGIDDKEYTPKKRSVRSYFGEDEACYIMDAKVQGNIGRYLNHSCSPNVFVQNVFVDTHDPRFPWVAFFALHHIRAGSELTWNYNYDVGSVPGKVMYCYCGAPTCRGRLL